MGGRGWSRREIFVGASYPHEKVKLEILESKDLILKKVRNWVVKFHLSAGRLPDIRVRC